MSPLPSLLLLLLAAISFLARLLRQRQRQTHSTSASDHLSQCEKGAALALLEQNPKPKPNPDTPTNDQYDDDVAFESDSLEMVGLAPRTVAHLFPAADSSDDQDLYESAAPFSYSVAAECVLHKKEKRGVKIVVESLGEDDDEEDDMRMGDGGLVDLGSMQVKGVREVVGEWEGEAVFEQGRKG